MMLNVFLNYVNLVFLLPYQVIYHYKQETYCVISIQVIKGVEVKVFVIIKFSNIIVFLYILQILRMKSKSIEYFWDVLFL